MTKEQIVLVKQFEEFVTQQYRRMQRKVRRLMYGETSRFTLIWLARIILQYNNKC